MLLGSISGSDDHVQTIDSYHWIRSGYREHLFRTPRGLHHVCSNEDRISELQILVSSLDFVIVILFLPLQL
jgi:hypothetical protein